MRKAAQFNKEVVLIRHATPAISDTADPELSEVGVQQAQKIAQSLQDLALHEFQCFTSPMLRCLQTATILSKTLKKKFCVNHRLAESLEFLAEDEKICIPNRENTFPNFDWPQGDFFLKQETLQEFSARTLDVLHSLPHKTIVITHYGFICNMMRLTLDDRANKLVDQEIPPASVTYINKDELQCLGNQYAQQSQN